MRSLISTWGLDFSLPPNQGWNIFFNLTVDIILDTWQAPAYEADIACVASKIVEKLIYFFVLHVCIICMCFYN